MNAAEVSMGETISLAKNGNGGGPIHARVPIHAHPQFS